MVRRCVGFRNLMNEEALAHWGAVAPKINKQTFYEYEDSVRKFDVHESVHRDTFMKMTNKMHFFFQALNFF